MIEINRDKYRMGLVNKLIQNIDKGIHVNGEIIKKLKELEHEGDEALRNRIINTYITATEVFNAGNYLLFNGEVIHTKRELWKKLNRIGIYYTVPLWKLDKTVEEIIQTRKIKQSLTDKEQKLIDQLLKN